MGLSMATHSIRDGCPNASGIDAALKILKKKGKVRQEHTDIIAIAGDGGTFDIGIQALSGAVERGHDFLFILYDNEGYMNTGIQRSGGTPRGAATTTTPAGSVMPGKMQNKKPITDIMVAHEMEYVATATPYYWKDMLQKVRKGLEVEGPAFLHIFAPCPRLEKRPCKTIYTNQLSNPACSQFTRSSTASMSCQRQANSSRLRRRRRNQSQNT